MAMFGSFKEGSWSLRSKKDPRWNCSGRGIVGGFMCPEANDAIEKLKKKYGKPPKDLELSAMKD